MDSPPNISTIVEQLGDAMLAGNGGLVVASAARSEEIRAKLRTDPIRTPDPGQLICVDLDEALLSQSQELAMLAQRILGALEVLSRRFVKVKIYEELTPRAIDAEGGKERVQTLWEQVAERYPNTNR